LGLLGLDAAGLSGLLAVETRQKIMINLRFAILDLRLANQS
jgi:hypothetical protein